MIHSTAAKRVPLYLLCCDGAMRGAPRYFINAFMHMKLINAFFSFCHVSAAPSRERRKAREQVDLKAQHPVCMCVWLVCVFKFPDVKTLAMKADCALLITVVPNDSEHPELAHGSGFGEMMVFQR